MNMYASVDALSIFRLWQQAMPRPSKTVMKPVTWVLVQHLQSALGRCCEQSSSQGGEWAQYRARAPHSEALDVYRVADRQLFSGTVYSAHDEQRRVQPRGPSPEGLSD